MSGIQGQEVGSWWNAVVQSGVRDQLHRVPDHGCTVSQRQGQRQQAGECEDAGHDESSSGYGTQGIRFGGLANLVVRER